MIGPDTAMFFNFAQKNFDDLARFWILIMIVGFIHESAHGLTCKHYGGQVHSMGLMFLYLTPCFFVDVTESWVSATKIQRLATIIAGIWIELVVCGIAMAFWLHAPAGSWFHKLMYEFILLTGIAAVIINLNPLLKLDGYYFLTEIIEIPELKERSSSVRFCMDQGEDLPALGRYSGSAPQTCRAFCQLCHSLGSVQLPFDLFRPSLRIPHGREMAGRVRPDSDAGHNVFHFPLAVDGLGRFPGLELVAHEEFGPLAQANVRAQCNRTLLAAVYTSLARSRACLLRDRAL